MTQNEVKLMLDLIAGKKMRRRSWGNPTCYIAVVNGVLRQYSCAEDHGFNIGDCSLGYLSSALGEDDWTEYVEPPKRDPAKEPEVGDVWTGCCFGETRTITSLLRDERGVVKAAEYSYSGNPPDWRGVVNFDGLKRGDFGTCTKMAE